MEREGWVPLGREGGLLVLLWLVVLMDCTVVRVVVMERMEWAGEEKVLLAPPSVRAAVALVPALEAPASLMVVSAVVERVGGRDWVAGEWWAWSREATGTESRLRAGETNPEPDMGVERSSAEARRRDICWYGWFLAALFFFPLEPIWRADFLAEAAWGLMSALEFLRLASRFIQAEKGRRRPCLSSRVLVRD